MVKKIYQILFPLKLRCWLSSKLRQPAVLKGYYDYDRSRFQKYCAASSVWDRENRLARITALYHVLEKGLSFRDSRPLFGKDKVLQLIADLKAFVKEEGDANEVHWQSALRVLDVYIVRSEASGTVEPNDPFLDQLKHAVGELREVAECDDVAGGGYVECTKSDIQARAKGGFPEMAFSRYSVRHFSDEPVDRMLVEQAVKWAQKSPSVCNRQASRVHAVRERDIIAEILELHGGTRGFTEQIDTLLIITGDLRIFLGPVERNQVFLDTGIFSMSLLYGLHYLGVGGCPLHWCVAPEKDAALRKLANIPAAETITALIGVGSLPKQFKVAYSQRRLTEDVLTWVSN